jgi:hypothetical protein
MSTPGIASMETQTQAGMHASAHAYQPSYARFSRDHATTLPATVLGDYGDQHLQIVDVKTRPQNKKIWETIPALCRPPWLSTVWFSGYPLDGSGYPLF